MDLLAPEPYLDGSIHQLFRSLPPVSRQPAGYWAVLGYPEARQVLTQPMLYSSAFGTGVVNEPESTFVSLNLNDPPAHTALRRQVVEWLGRVRPAYQAEKEPLRGLPRQTLQAILRIEEGAAAQLQGLAQRIAYAADRKARREAEDELLERLHALDCPIGVQLEATDRLYLLRLLVLSGLESTTTALASLCRHRPAPDQIEEMLRLYPPIQRFGRRVMAPVTLGGERLRAGDRVIVFFAAANRDPRVFEQPDTWMTGRRTAHLSFGAGPHRCPGATLARRQLRWLLPAPPPPPARYHSSSFTMGPLLHQEDGELS